MINVSTEFLNKLEISKYILNDMTPAERLNILDKYDRLADAVINKTPGSVFNGDADNYGIILNKNVFDMFIRKVSMADMQNYQSLANIYKIFQRNLSNSAQQGAQLKSSIYKSIYREFCNKIAETGVPVSNADINTEMIQLALKTFGLNIVDETIETDILTEDIDNDEDNPNFLFDDEDDFDLDIEPDEEDMDNEEEFDIDKLLNDTSEQEEDDFETMPEDEEDTPEETDVTKDKYFNAFKQIYEGPEEGSSTPLRSSIDGIMKSLYDLYMACYSGITTPDGILTNKGLLSFDKINGKYKFVYNHVDIDANNKDVTSPEYIKYKQNGSEYGKYYKAIMYAIGVASCGAQEINIQIMSQEQMTKCIESAIVLAEEKFGKAIDGRKSALPKYEDANSTNYYPRLHTEFMTGNFSICKEMHSWAEDNKVRRNKVKITNFDDLMKWARIRVSDCLTQALIDARLKIEDAGTNDGVVTSICQVMAKKIKNIIVLPNTKNGYFTIKICTSEVINDKILSKGIADYFNSGSAGSKSANVIVKNNGADSGVIELDVVLNQKEYDKSSSFSADVIDSIIETGNIPSWSNAILGEKNTGGAFTYNFRNKYAIAIYGASGSGKGIMTSALISNAIAEGCSTLYIDGKPDNGAALGKVAWDAGMEAAVFNACTGKTAGGSCKTFPAFLEDYSHGIRDKSIRDAQIAKIPLLPDIDPDLWPFSAKNEQNRGMLYEVSLTLKSFEVVQNIIIQRSMGGDALEKLPNGDTRWAVIVIDEIENAANNEDTIRKAIKTYMDRVGEREVFKTEVNSKGEQVEKRAGKIKDYKNWSKDEGYLFCRQWLDWADNVCSNWASLVTISLRNSCTTLITIFQANRWFNQSGNVTTGSTKIGKLMLALSAKVVKIVGKNALVSSNTWGDETSYKWSPEVDKGKWVVATNEGTLDDSDTVFKPFKVFTTDLGDGVEVPFDDYGAGATGCWQALGDRNNKALRKPLGLQSYLKYMFMGLQSEMEAQLERGERLPGTLTPEGVLQTSFDYYNRLLGGNLLNEMYTVKPISEYTGVVSEDEAEQMADRALATEEELGDLNADLNNPDEDEEPLDFGSYDNSVMPPANNMHTGTDMPIPGDKVNNIGEQQSIEDEHAANQLIKETQQIKNLKLITTQMLIRANYSDRVLTEYLDKVLNKPVTISGTNTKKPILENNLYNYTNRNPREFGGLKLAAITFSSLVYIQAQRNLIDLSDIKSQAMKQIRSLNDTTDKWKFMLGMIEDYETSALANDEMPSEDRMRYYQQKFALDIDVDSDNQYIDSEFTGDGQFNSEDDYWMRMQSVPEEDIYDGHDVFKNNKNGFIDIKPRETQNAVRLNLDDYLEASAPNWSTMERFKKKLFESKNGIAYEFKKRWDYVLKEIGKKYPDKALVRRMAFSELQVAVNGRISMFNNLIGGEDEILITDILRIRDTFKKFPFIQEITFDGPTTQCLIDEYGTSAQEIWSIFQENRSLKTLIISVNNNIQRFDRATFANTADKLNGMLGLQVTKMQLENFASEYNPRLENKSPGYINRIIKNGTSKASSWFKKSKKTSKQHPIVSKRTKVALGAAGLIAVGAVIGLPGILAAGITGTFGYFKGRS